MKKYLLFLYLAIPALALGILSCNKDDDGGNTPKTKRELLTQASWKYKSATVNGAAFNSFPTCETDNTVSFSNPNSGVRDEGLTKCDPGDPQSTPFTWSFQNGETEILLSSGLFTNGSATVTLVSVTETELVISFAYSTPGPIFFVQVTFQH